MTITYCIGKSLYVNITNRCSNDCKFCIRGYGDSVGGAESLWLEREPSREEILADIKNHDLTGYDEIVFCGYGEPCERLDDLLWVCKELKKSNAPIIRVNTNGHASLLAGYAAAPLFESLVDKISISLNAASAGEYDELCKPIFGEQAYEGVIDFATSVKKYVPDVTLSIVGGTTNQQACQVIAEKLGFPLRVR